VPFNFNVSVSGVATGDRVGDRLRAEFAIIGPWEGASVVNLTAWYYEENAEPFGLDGWARIPATRDGMLLTLDLSDVPEGQQELWFVAFDDRGVYSTVIVEDVQVDHPESRFTLGWVLALAFIGIVVALVAALIAVIRIRRRRAS
jgi:hypothetical protein